MFSFLEHIRRHPEHIRRYIAYGVSAFLFFTVAGAWVAAGGFSFSKNEAVADASAPSPVSAPSPWSQVADALATAGKGIIQSVSDLGSVVASGGATTSATDL